MAAAAAADSVTAVVGSAASAFSPWPARAAAAPEAMPTAEVGQLPPAFSLGMAGVNLLLRLLEDEGQLIRAGST